jgi:hypothetical protein
MRISTCRRRRSFWAAQNAVAGAVAADLAPTRSGARSANPATGRDDLCKTANPAAVRGLLMSYTCAFLLLRLGF